MSSTQHLDGWWQFRPVYEGPAESGAADPAPPDEGFESTLIRVPGYWNTFPAVVGGDWEAYRHYNYPAAWQNAPAGWYRLLFPAAPAAEGAGRRTTLCFDAVAGRSVVWLNGRRLGANQDSFFPFEFDVTAVLRAGGSNELLLYVSAPPQREGLWLQPCGSWVGWYLRGISQSVRLVCRPDPAIRDVFAQPSVSLGRLAVEVTLECQRDGKRSGPMELELRVEDRGRTVLDLGRKAVECTGPGPTVVTRAADWPDARRWCPEDPHCYALRAVLRVAGQVADERCVRFGFREFVIDGLGFKLNGRPIRLFGDSWHYMGPAQQNPAYARTWFELARQTGVNVIRTHAMPYPPCYFDVADEMGMLIIAESAVYGSAGTLAYAQEAFWDNSREHIRRMVRRDRNHPAIIVWSACNETVWKGGEAIYPGLLSLAEEARRHDPTRVVTFDENDCHVGGGAAVHAGHYGTPQHWERSWKRDRPLTLHEFCSLYWGGPDSVSGVGGQQVYADYQARLWAAGQDAADMFLQMRSLGAASITPWNIVWYCLEPGPARAVEHVPEAATAGGAPLERIGARALTLNYGYLPGEPPWRPNPAYAPLAECYRRQRFYIRHRPRQGFAGERIIVEAEVWNDVAEGLDARLIFELSRPGCVAGSASQAVTLGACGAERIALEVQLPADAADIPLQARLRLEQAGSGQALHAEDWAVHVHSRPAANPEQCARVRILGGAWAAAGGRTVPIGLPEQTVGPEDVDLTGAGVLVLTGGQEVRTLTWWLERGDVRAWLQAGGRLVVLPGGVRDDAASALSAVRRRFDRAFLRAADSFLLAGLSADHFRDWGPDGTVAVEVFHRPATGPAVTPLDVGDPAEGLAYTPLVILPEGRGHVVLSGLDLLERAADTPAAAILLERLLFTDLPGQPVINAVIAGPQSAESMELLTSVGLSGGADGDFVLCSGQSAEALADPDLAERRVAELLERGGTLVVDNITPQTAAAWSARLDLDLQVQADERCNVALTVAGARIGGLNNFDLCWVNRDDAQPITRYTLAADPAAGTTLIETVATRWEGYQSAAEQYKVAMMYRRIEAFGGSRAVLVEIPRGRGRIILNQMLLGEARGQFKVRARRIMSRLLDAWGLARDPAVSPLRPRERSPVNADGYITDWLVLGPFTGAPGHPLDHTFIDEAGVEPAEGRTAGGLAWQRVAAAFPQVDLAGAFADLPARERVAYAAVYVYSAQDRSVLLDAPDMLRLLAGADSGLKILLNGVALGRFDFVRELLVDSDCVDGVPLRKGWNRLVLKLHNPSGAWRFAARLTTGSGEPAGELQYALTPPS